MSVTDEVLNSDSEPTEITDAEELSKKLRSLVLKLYGKHIAGKVVDYVGIRADPNFKEYLRLAANLRTADCAKLSRDARLAFFINIYNALFVHAVIEGGKTDGDERQKLFNRMCYNIGGHNYSLNNIENGILRGNQPGAGKNKELPFHDRDPRLKVSIDGGEPRIHFALNCGANGCPAIRAYSAESISVELDNATSLFLSDKLNCCVQDDVLYLSEIFNWYRSDFGQTDCEVASFVVRFVKDDEKKQKILALLDGSSMKIDYLPYDLTHNSA